MSIETNQSRLKAQQIVLKHLGYYSGDCDGIWGPDSIKAKKEFEFKSEFKPAYPNSGLPFEVQGPFPTGIYLDPTKPRHITHLELTPERVEELSKLRPVSKEKVSEPKAMQESPAVDSEKVDEPKASSTQEPEPKVEHNSNKHQRNSRKHR